MSETPDVSVIVPCRNERDAIDAFCRSLAAQGLGGLGWEVIIADGKSTDGTCERLSVLQREHGFIRVVENPGLIVSTGLNTALALASADLIIRMDVHATYSSDYVRRSVEILRTTRAWNVGGPTEAVGREWVGRAIAAVFHSPFASGGARWHSLDYCGPTDTVPFGCWRRETLIQLGGFDETLVRNQDDELNLRILRSGGVIWQSPEIRSQYTPRGSLNALWRQYLQYGFWKVAVIRKHHLPASWRHLVPGAFVATLVLLFAGGGVAWLAGWFTIAWVLLLSGSGLLLVYALLVLGASLWTARANGWRLLPVLPAVFAAYQLSYGVGFLAGMLRWAFGSSSRGATPAKYIALTR